jgi:uncharacterized protein with HEPN domain
MKGTDAAIYVESMLEAARRATGHIEGLSESDFLADLLVQDGVCMCLIAIGEAAKQLMRESPEVVAAAGDLAWPQMARMRDRIAHGYETLNMSVVWATANADLDPLLRRLPSILAELPKPVSSTSD